MFAVVYLIMSIIGWAVTEGSYHKDERLQIFEGIVSILFYGFGLLVTQRFRQKGLRVVGFLDHWTEENNCGTIFLMFSMDGWLSFCLLLVPL